MDSEGLIPLRCGEVMAIHTSASLLGSRTLDDTLLTVRNNVKRLSFNFIHIMAEVNN
jgi:hypothetical protein